MKTRRSPVDSLSLERPKVISLLPELWSLIFTIRFDNRVSQIYTQSSYFDNLLLQMEEAEYFSLESMLKVVSSVCYGWNKLDEN